MFSFPFSKPDFISSVMACGPLDAKTKVFQSMARSKNKLTESISDFRLLYRGIRTSYPSCLMFYNIFEHDRIIRKLLEADRENKDKKLNFNFIFYFVNAQFQNKVVLIDCVIPF